ncbi:MAG TPA: hypothetical protein VKY89_23405, partial [Thermoanaerobaculia bacterium]|nr:hypothetical protein [Thermoanaerobaculia bacterium]
MTRRHRHGQPTEDDPGTAPAAPETPAGQAPEPGVRQEETAGYAPPGAAACYVEVALPVPLPEPLVYAVPPGCQAIAVPGVRVRVRMGKRRLVGVVVGQRDEPPAGVAIRWLDGVLDREPVLGPDLLELARFTADYYLAPLGEALRSMLPADLEPWGDRRVWLTDRGALALPRAEAESAVLEALREGGRVRVSELQAGLGLIDLDAVLAELEAGGRIAGEDSRARPGRSSRYVAAVELVPGLEETAAAGRSAQGLAVVEYLTAVARPATSAEVMAAVGC